MKKTGPWTKLSETAECRYPDPLDGRVWSLDGTPRWLVMVETCCEGEDLHFIWSLGDKVDGKGVDGSEETRELAKEKADAAMVAAGWTLT